MAESNHPLSLPPGASRDGRELEYRAPDGAELGYVAYRGNDADTALVYLHGIESHAGWFALAASRFCDLGYDVFCLDRRGSGINRENKGFVSGHVDGYRTLLADIDAFLNSIRDAYHKVILVGLSWGGKLATAYALAHPTQVDAVILITPGLCALVDLQLKDKLKVILGAGPLPTMGVATPIAPEMFTTTPKFLQYIRNDPLRLKEASARFFLQSVLLDRLIARRIETNRLPVLLFLAGRDRIIDNRRVIALLSRAKASPLTQLIFEEQTHSIQFDAPDRLVDASRHWLANLA